MNDKKEQLEKSISFIKHRLKKFTDEELLTEEGNKTYNRLLIKKATMVKNLNEISKNKFREFFNKYYRKFTGKTLICDHF